MIAISPRARKCPEFAIQEFVVADRPKPMIANNCQIVDIDEVLT
jgi:hypothetical protein